VKPFATGNYYGKAGIPITIITCIILLFIIIPRTWAKRVNLFLSAFLVAYCFRTFIIFTASLFEGEVEKKVGIYLMLICSVLIMIASMFPKKNTHSEL
jgi:hypothetical protein